MMDVDRARMLHNGICPFNYKCLALDCMECIEQFEKVDGLASKQNGKVNTASDGGHDLEESI